jgi:predicted enzyme related to lactoylglutathione lyase
MPKKKSAGKKKPAKRPAKKAKKPTKAKKPAKRAAPAAPLRGQFVWYELMTTDRAGAKRFYTQVAAWGTTAYPQDPSYTMWTNKGAPLGGLMALPEDARRKGVPPNWTAYVTTPDVDAAARQAVALGGKILKAPSDIPGTGRFAIVRDPQGAVIAVYKSTQASPAPTGDPKNGEFSWHELATTDHGAALRFYSALLGWVKTDAMDMGPGGLYQMFGTEKKRSLGGIYNKKPDMPGPPFWLYYIKVDSADRAAEKVKAAGGKVLNGPMDIPGGGRIAQCLDPQGAAFAVHSGP